MPSGSSVIDTSPMISRSNPRAVSISPGVALSRRFSRSDTTSAHLDRAAAMEWLQTDALAFRGQREVREK